MKPTSILFRAVALMVAGLSTLSLADDATDAKIREALPAKAGVTPKKPRKLLVFSRCEGPRHECVDMAQRTFVLMGEKTGAFTAETAVEMDAFDEKNLARFDGILLNNTTNLKFENQSHRKALLDFVGKGKGIVGIHAAADNFQVFPEAGEMMGGYFDGHPWTFDGTWAVKLDEPKHPLNRAFKGKNFAIRDEIYQIRGPYSRSTHRVLLSLDMDDPRNKKDQGINRTDNDFAISWIKRFGEGRVFYCSLGHNPEVYWNPMVLQHYLDGIQYALGDAKVDDKPSKP